MKPTERIRRAVLQRLESARQAGLQQVPKAAPSAEPVKAPASAAEASASAESPAPRLHTSALFEVSGAVNEDEVVANAPTLKVLEQQVASCTRCAELAQTRTQTVFGVGDPAAQLCFLGEAPGADEDRLGEPFVGRAGKLLTDIIEKGMRLRREDVYILNILKCRPPGNRNPLPTEAENCEPFLLQQFELIRPQFICCLGAVAAQNLLQTTTSIGKLRGRVHDWRGMGVVCTYHPAYLLRNPAAKVQAWEDIQLLMETIDQEDSDECAG